MALRIVNSTIAASSPLIAGEFWAVIAGQNLTDYLTSVTSVRPTALTLVGNVTTQKCTELVLEQNEPGGEVLHRLYNAGSAIGLAALFAAFARDAVRPGAITPLTFLAEKGLKLRLIGCTGASPVTLDVVWDLCSDCGTGAAEGEEAAW
jgi:hypothetical protein